MRVVVLGSVGLIDEAGSLVSLGSAKLRSALGLLVAADGRLVTMDSFADELWPEQSPKSARKSVASQVHRLRNLLGADAVIRDMSGYRLVLAPEQVDAWHFEKLAAAAHRARAAGDPEAAASGFAEALACWQGEPYAGLDAPATLRRERERLSGVRLRTLEASTELDVERGHHAERLADLTILVAENPLRESLRASLMLALCRSARTGEALQTYRDYQARLADDLGLEPGPELRALEARIRAGEVDVGTGMRRTYAQEPQQPETSTAAESSDAPKTMPAELPADVTTFTGRDAEIADLQGRLTGGSVLALHGPGGVGKSALALRLAHHVGDRFPDGQLYLDLFGAKPGIDPVRPEEVPARMLRSLGMEAPKDPAEAAARFRTVTAERRVLVVLDDAVDAAQVRDLLPGSESGAAVIISSRVMLSTLDIASHHLVERLTEDESVRLLAAFAGEEQTGEERGAAEQTGGEWTGAEPGVMAQIAGLCGHLPLALRIAGAKLASRPDRPPAWLADRLAEEGDRLDELAHGDLAVRASLMVGLDALDAEDSRMFTLLGLLDIPTMSVALAAVLADRSQGQAGRSLDRLAQAHLVFPVDDDRYGMHDLVRLYARERAAELPAPERDAAFLRALHWYIATARTASLISAPSDREEVEIGLPARDLLAGRLPTSGLPTSGLPTGGLPTGKQSMDSAAAAMAWIEAEKDNLLALTEQAQHSEDGTGLGALKAEFCALVVAIHRAFNTRGLRWVVVRIGRIAVEWATTSDLDQGSIGRVELVVGSAFVVAGDREPAERLLTSALQRFEQAGASRFQVGALNQLAALAMMRGDKNLGMQHFSAASELLADDDMSSASRNLRHNLAKVRYLEGDYRAAIQGYAAVLQIDRRIGARRGEAWELVSLAAAHRAAGDEKEALDYAYAALELSRTIGAREAEADTLWTLGDIRADADDDDGARAYWRDSLAILEDLGSVDRETARILLKTPRPQSPIRN